MDYFNNCMGWACGAYGWGEGVYRVLLGKPEGRKPLGRPRRRWVVNIRMDLQEVRCGYMDWIGLAQDRDRWRTLVSAVMNLRVLWNAGNFLTSCKPVSFSKRTLHIYLCIYLYNSTEQGPSSEANSFSASQEISRIIYVYIYLCIYLHNSTEQGPSSEANSFSASQEISRYIYIYVFTYTTPQSRVLLQKLTVSQQAKKFPALYIYIYLFMYLLTQLHRAGSFFRS